MLDAVFSNIEMMILNFLLVIWNRNGHDKWSIVVSIFIYLEVSRSLSLLHGENIYFPSDFRYKIKNRSLKILTVLDVLYGLHIKFNENPFYHNAHVSHTDRSDETVN
jgi:hypothetical protein